jgi:hypothetical protein
MPNMKTPHKHAAVIKAWADGQDIQVNLNGWVDALCPTWYTNYEYRVKPGPKKYRVALVTHKSCKGYPIIVEKGECTFVDCSGYNFPTEVTLIKWLTKEFEVEE